MPNPVITMQELHEVGERFLKVAEEYWKAAHKAGVSGAAIWLEDSEKGLVIFTRAEYRETLMRNIHELGPIYNIGAAAGDDR